MEGFLKEHGNDPRELDEKDSNWLQYRSTILTDFMRDLRQKLGQLARRQGRKSPVALSAWVFGDDQENLLYGMDVPTWIREGLIDGVIPYTSADGLFSWEPAWENIGDVEHWLSLTRETNCELALNVMPRHLTTEQFRRKAHQLYQAGVTYLAFWDSSKTWAEDKMDQGCFQHLRRLGHSEELASWVQAGQPDLVPSTTRLQKVGEWEMTFIAE